MSPIMQRLDHRVVMYARRRPTLVEVVAEKAVEGLLACAVGAGVGIAVAWWLS